ncbi:MAG: FHA domain-containing protein [Streptosporangiaceae bacterium]
MSKGGVLPGLWPIHGDGVLARQGDLVLLIHPAGGTFADRLLDLLTDAAQAGQDGIGFTSHITAEFDADAAAANMAEPGPSAVAFGPDGDGTAVALYGTAWAEITTANGMQRLSPGQPYGRLRCVLPSQVTTVRAGVREGDTNADTDPYLRLADGVVRAVALAYAPEPTAPGAPPRARRPALASVTPPIVAPIAPPENVVPEPANVVPAPENLVPEPENVAPQGVTPAPENAAEEIPAGGRPQDGGFNWDFGRPPGPVQGGPPAENLVGPGPVSPGPVSPGPVSPGPVSPGPVSPGPVGPGPGPARGGPPGPPPGPGGAPAWDFVSVQFGQGQPGSEVPRRPPLPLGPEPPLEQNLGVAETRAPEVLGVYCKNGHFDDPEARYCAVCGISMAQLTKAPRKGKRPPLGVLVLEDGSVFQLDADYVIGREPSLDSSVADGSARPLRLTDSEGLVSRIHAKIELDGWQVYISDLESANGTYIQLPGEPDGKLLPPRVRTPLVAGARVRVGRDHGFTYDSHRHR